MKNSSQQEINMMCYAGCFGVDLLTPKIAIYKKKLFDSQRGTWTINFLRLCLKP